MERRALAQMRLIHLVVQTLRTPSCCKSSLPSQTPSAERSATRSSASERLAASRGVRRGYPGVRKLGRRDQSSESIATPKSHSSIVSLFETLEY